MYILKNTLKNIGRNKGRNLIMGAILFLLIFTIAISVIINTSANSTIAYYKEQFGAEVVMARNNEKMPANLDDYHLPSLADMRSYADSSLLKGSQISAKIAASLVGINTLDSDLNSGKGAASDGMGGSSNDNGYRVNSFIIASNQNEINEEFSKGLRKIIEGTLYQNVNDIIISQNLSKHANLGVGDSVTIRVSSPYDGKIVSEIKANISGIYEDHAPVDENVEFKSALTNRGNEIFMSMETAESSKLFESDLAVIAATFKLKDPNDLDKLQKEFQQKGLPQYFELIADSSTYQKMVAPLEGLGNITKTFTIALFIFGSIVLIILSNIAIRERKYEIGVLRAIGMKKSRVSLSLISEMFIITAISLTLGLFAANLSSKPIANTVLSSQVEELKSNSNHEIGSKYVTGSTIVTVPIDEIDTNLNSSALSQIIVFASSLAIISSATGVMYITKFEPMQILSERN
ncbi:ABC transporter permease [Beduini massiliensis]|uniref:ABC transporter permease n=1 Tax=Beduini massiliensis TaxID=1585974 RepID=UPI00059A8C16|nr:FtsX-like permease family protein [Beduini massiliensis]